MNQSESSPFQAPRTANWAARLLGLLGWRLALTPPPGPRAILIVYPHTSNWDFPLGMLARFACGWPVHWVGKHTLFAPPWGGLMRRLGGIPIDRGAPGGFVDGLVAEFAEQPALLVAIAPEGTRRHVDRLKSGFYRIAVAGGIPIGLAYIDYATRSLGIADYIVPSGDPDADLERIRAAYSGKQGRHPLQAGEIRFG